jgi:hypothetical protein
MVDCSTGSIYVCSWKWPGIAWFGQGQLGNDRQKISRESE